LEKKAMVTVQAIVFVARQMTSSRPNKLDSESLEKDTVFREVFGICVISGKVGRGIIGGIQCLRLICDTEMDCEAWGLADARDPSRSGINQTTTCVAQCRVRQRGVHCSGRRRRVDLSADPAF
jgi:hypothetical protein